MSRLPAVVVRVRALRAEEERWRAQRPDLVLRTTVLDLLTSCGLQYYSDHSIRDDLRLLGRAVDLLGEQDQRRLGGDFERTCLRATESLDAETEDLRGLLGDLDVEDVLRRRIVDVPTRVIFGRTDDESSVDLVCWNETNCLLAGLSGPYRCAATVATVGYFNPPDRFGVVDRMVALRNAYHEEFPDRDRLDTEIAEAAREYVAWFGASWGGN